MARRVSSPEMVGRSETLAALMIALERAPGVVLVAGDAGIGKTRLLREFAATVEATVLWGDCVPMQAGELPYAPFAAACAASRCQASHARSCGRWPRAASTRFARPSGGGSPGVRSAMYTTAVIIWLEVLLSVAAVFGLLIGFAAGMMWLMGR